MQGQHRKSAFNVNISTRQSARAGKFPFRYYLQLVPVGYRSLAWVKQCALERIARRARPIHSERGLPRHLTEAQFGSNPSDMLTRAVQRGDRYILNGEKMWITNGSIADVALIWAKCEDDKIRGSLVEKGTKGFKGWDVHGKLSLRASVTSGLAMNDCEIPAENVLPGVAGLKGPLSCLTQARYGIGWGRATTRLCNTRKGKPPEEEGVSK